MSKPLKIIIRIAIWAFVVLLLYVGGIIIHGTIRDYQPEPKMTLESKGDPPLLNVQDSIVSFLIWNIGYGGLGKESNFFYDNGKSLFSGKYMVRAPQEIVEKNISEISNTIQGVKSDFFLLQEVDIKSKRSYYNNEFEQIQKILPGFSATFANNFLVDRMPLPLFEPWKVYGSVNSGLASYSTFQPVESQRLSLPGEFDWPVRLFQLDRCVLFQRFKVKENKELIVLNIHNSAYDKGGLLKKQQMTFLKNIFMGEYEKGNYIVAGGDWNQNPPFFQPKGFIPGFDNPKVQLSIDPEFLSNDWLWVYDPTIPTNRSLKTSFDKKESQVTLIDFFLISPNIRVRTVKGINKDFSSSDHQPVWMEVELL